MGKCFCRTDPSLLIKPFRLGAEELTFKRDHVSDGFPAVSLAPASRMQLVKTDTHVSSVTLVSKGIRKE